MCWYTCMPWEDKIHSFVQIHMCMHHVTERAQASECFIDLTLLMFKYSFPHDSRLWSHSRCWGLVRFHLKGSCSNRTYVLPRSRKAKGLLQKRRDGMAGRLKDLNIFRHKDTVAFIQAKYRSGVGWVSPSYDVIAMMSWSHSCFSWWDVTWLDNAIGNWMCGWLARKSKISGLWQHPTLCCWPAPICWVKKKHQAPRFSLKISCSVKSRANCKTLFYQSYDFVCCNLEATAFS